MEIHIIEQLLRHKRLVQVEVFLKTVLFHSVLCVLDAVVLTKSKQSSEVWIFLGFMNCSY